MLLLRKNVDNSRLFLLFLQYLRPHTNTVPRFSSCIWYTNTKCDCHICVELKKKSFRALFAVCGIRGGRRTGVAHDIPDVNSWNICVNRKYAKNPRDKARVRHTPSSQVHRTTKIVQKRWYCSFLYCKIRESTRFAPGVRALVPASFFSVFIFMIFRLKRMLAAPVANCEFSYLRKQLRKLIGQLPEKSADMRHYFKT